MLEDQFSIKEENQLYYKDIFIGYILVIKDKLLRILNHIELAEIVIKNKSKFKDDHLYVDDIRVIDIKNINFNNRILNKIKLIPDYKESHTHYAITLNNSVYTSFLTTNYTEAVNELIRLKKENLLGLFDNSYISYSIKPLNLP